MKKTEKTMRDMPSMALRDNCKRCFGMGFIESEDHEPLKNCLYCAGTGQNFESEEDDKNN